MAASCGDQVVTELGLRPELHALTHLGVRFVELAGLDLGGLDDDSGPGLDLDLLHSRGERVHFAALFGVQLGEVQEFIEALAFL